MWLDRVRKLPVYVVGESVFALALATVPIAAWTGVLSMTWLYVVGFVLGCVHVFGGTAAQIVLTQIVSRERLVEAHSKNALAVSGSEIAGPGLAGALIKLLGAPIAIAFDALLIAGSVLLLRGIRVDESLVDRPAASFMRQLRDGLRLCFAPGCWMLALFVGCWQLLHHTASVVQILVATRELGMTAQAIGMRYVGMGVGTILASVYGKRERTRRPRPHHRGGLRGQRGRLAGAGGGAGERVRRGAVRLHADLLLRRRDADLRELPVAPAGGHA